ncbi:MAG: FecR family protein [Anaerolineae bacterium]|nr:FecR family protein [Anaerolineae bacterium]MDH7474198.1 FecR domain-containing protein [Anaerolineae bacterium]
MRKNPERLAWIVLLTAFAIFCTLAVSLPLGIRAYVRGATSPQLTRLTPINGTIRVIEPGKEEPIAVTSTKDDVPEGARVIADATSGAFLTFFDDSKLRLYENTQIILRTSRAPRFSAGNKPNTVKIDLENGRVRIGVAPAIARPLHFEIRTPHAVINLQEGSYSIQVTSEETRIAVVQLGQATVSALGQTVTLKQNERATVAAGQSPVGPLPKLSNVIVNGDFRQPLDIGWLKYDYKDVAEEAGGQVEIVVDNARRVARFIRQGGNIYHGETGIQQMIELDVRDFSYLELRLDVRLLEQSLSGCGYRSSECPVIVLLDYKDAHNNDRQWYHGFYYQNKDNLPVWEAELIPQNVWYPYESGNLMELLGDARPAYLTSIRIYASGWDYQSMVSNVELLAEE